MSKDVSSPSDQLTQSPGSSSSDKLASHVYGDLMPRYLPSSIARPEPQVMSFDSIYSPGSDSASTPKKAQTERQMAMQVMNFLTDRGLTPAQAAGVVGNFDFDTKLNPDFRAVGEDKGCGGISDTYLPYEQDWAKLHNLPADALKTQLEYAWSQMVEDFPGGAVADKMMWNPKMTVAESTNLYAVKIGRPPHYQETKAARIAAANKVLDWYRDDQA